MTRDARGQAESLLGVELPDGASDVRFHRWRPSPDLAYFYAYVKLACTREAFQELADRLGLAGRESGGAAYLPASWKGPPDTELHWWDAAAETPPDARAASWGVNGWIVAKHEGGSAYVVVTDTGSEEGRAGPW